MKEKKNPVDERKQRRRGMKTVTQREREIEKMAERKEQFLLAENYLLILFLRQDFQGNNCSLLASRPCFVDRDRIWRQSTTLRKKEREHSRGDRESKQILQQTGEKGRKKKYERPVYIRRQKTSYTLLFPRGSHSLHIAFPFSSSLLLPRAKTLTTISQRRRRYSDYILRLKNDQISFGKRGNENILTLRKFKQSTYTDNNKSLVCGRKVSRLRELLQEDVISRHRPRSASSEV